MTTAREMAATGAADPGEFSFRTWPFYWLTQASGRYVQRMEQELKAVGLDVPRWRVLMTLHEAGSLSVSAIAEHAIAKLPTMLKIVRRMEADGLVVCDASTRDGRVTEVRLTPAGEAAGRQAWDAAHRLYDQVFAGRSPHQIAKLTRLLVQLSDALG